MTWRRRLGLFGVALAFGLPLAGYLYESLALAWARRQTPPQGRWVDLGGRRLHVREAGQGQPGPTVILESGLGCPSPYWTFVQGEIATSAPVVAYDRAGTLASEPSSRPPDARNVAEDLHEALQRAGIPGPYVLVGHSLGGLYVRGFASRYPAEVAGMVLIEASHPDQLAHMSPASRAKSAGVGAELRQSIWQQRFGWLRLRSHVEPSDWEAYPKPVQAEIEAWFGAATWRAAWAEWSTWEATSNQVRATPDLGTLPLRVLTAGTRRGPKEDAAAWRALQESLVHLSTRGTQRVVEGATHDSLVTDPEHARTVAQAVREVLAEARLKTSPSTPDGH